MKATCINQIQLAARWGISHRTLERWRWTGKRIENRADLCLVPGVNGGGSVLSVSSIAWTGCLWTDNASNKVATITRNVIDRFRNSGKQA